MRIFILIFTIFSLLSTVAFSKQKIMVIESYHAEYPWDKSYKAGLAKIFKDEFNLVYFEMDTKRKPANLYNAQANLAWEKYQQESPDLVILGDDNALKYLGPKFGNGNIPTVYLGINGNPREYINFNLEGKNISGILERPYLQRSIVMLQVLLKPKPSKILVLFDSGTTSQIIYQDFFKGKKTLIYNSIQIDIELLSSWKKWKKIVLDAKLNQYDAIIFGLYHTITDEFGNNIDSEKLIKWSCANTPIPPFGFWDFSVGPDKTIGGLVLWGKEQGIEAAKLAKEILKKNQFNQIYKHFPPVTADQGKFYFSKSNLKKYGIKLPTSIEKMAYLTD